MRALGYDERLKKGERSRIARRCWEEIISRVEEGRELSNWEKKRVEFLSKRRMSLSEKEEVIGGKGKMRRLRESEREL